MTNPSYANLNTKSHYSCGLGIGTSAEVIKAAQDQGLYAIAITDRCTASGLLDFYNKGKELKFPVILGVEMYVHHNTELYRLILLAKNQNGYTNICKLITASSLNKEAYKRPCVSLYDLQDNKEDLFCLSNALDVTSHLESIFKDYFYYEVILEDELIEVNKRIIEHSNFVISSDAYIPTAEFKVLQDIMISNTAYGFSKEPFKYIKSILSLKQIVNRVVLGHKYLDTDKLKNGFSNSKYVADECKGIELKFKDQIVNYPHLLHPLNHDSVSKEDLVRRIIKDNGRMKYDDPVYVERLEYELQTIQNNGRVNLIDYFLVLEDLCRWCRENNIAVGPGRGSGAGSLVNYCLKVTHLDPIKYGLLFERFISAGRIQKGTLPDVDLDFSEQEPVRQHAIEMYGEDRVIPIGTMQTLKARGAIKDIFRAFHPDLEFQYVQNICNALGQKDQEETEAEHFEFALETSEVLQKAFKEYPDVEQYVKRLLGYNRQPGIHPCGLAITQDPLKDFVPLRFDKEKWVNELTANDCEKSGIIKYDILGLKTLKYIQTCLQLCGIDDLYSIPLEDKETFKAFVAGDTTSVFQFNSDVSRNILMQLPLSKMSLDTLSMVTSVGRPGPMKNNQHNEFIKRVNGARSCRPPHEALYDTLEPTYGIMIYQESVMRASQILGGFTLAEADDIRKAMGKKKASVLAPYKSRFIDYCKANFVDTAEKYRDEDNREFESKAEYIWELMATFSGYGFNKSHSMAYALIGYYCQYLKVNYPLQWWTACMTHADSDQLRLYYQECSMICINPDINKATSEFYITKDNKIQMPFTCIKGLGPKAAEEIAARRPYASFNDFVTRVNKTKVNKAVVEKLIFCGCFDSFETNPQVLIDQYYEFRGEMKKMPEDLKLLTNSKVQEMRSKGLSFLSMDYYKIYPHFFPDNEMIYFQNLVKGGKVCVGGIVTKVVMKKTKTNKDYCDMIIANDGEEQSIRIWGDEFEVYKNSIEVAKIVRVICNTSEYNSKLQLTATNILALTKE